MRSAARARSSNRVNEPPFEIAFEAERIHHTGLSGSYCLLDLRNRRPSPSATWKMTGGSRSDELRSHSRFRTALGSFREHCRRTGARYLRRNPLPVARGGDGVARELLSTGFKGTPLGLALTGPV
jgi:hypothetical protein